MSMGGGVVGKVVSRRIRFVVHSEKKSILLTLTCFATRYFSSDTSHRNTGRSR